MSGVPTQVLTFRAGGAALAARADTVREVFRDARTTRVPNAPASLAGVASLRGAVVPVVSAARLLGEDEAPLGPQSRVLLLGLAEPVALRVDAVGGLRTLVVEDEGSGAPLGQLFLQEGDAGRLVDLAGLLERDFGALARVRSDLPDTPAPSATPEAAAPELAILTFELAGQAYGLRLEEVAEVLAAPAHIKALPHADAAMVGVLPLRDTLLPVVALRSLLGLAGHSEPSGHGRIVVAQLGEVRVGLLVDRLQAILRVAPESLEPVPAILNRGAGEARIDTICRLADGRGLVSVLSAARVFREESLAQILADGRQQGAQMTETQTGATRQIVVFRLGDEDYGMPIGDVEEVVRLPQTLTRAPKAPAFVLGLMSLRGQLLPVIDQMRRFGVSGETASSGRRVIVTTVGDRRAGFVVDAVSEILALPDSAFAPNSSLAAEAAELFDQVAHVDASRILLIVNPQALLDRAERDLLAGIEAAAADPAAS